MSCRITRRTFVGISTAIAGAASFPNVAHSSMDGTKQSYDIVIYGGSSAGIAAAVQAARMGKSTLLIEPGNRLGGLSSSGLGATDIGNKSVIGGISREFYARVARHYHDPSAWQWQSPEAYFGQALSQTETMWTFEPRVALNIFEDWVREAPVDVLFGERLALRGGVRKEDSRITAIRMESGRVLRGSMFIDATYEGDLMACSSVSFTVGREANHAYGETLNGAQARMAMHHQLHPSIDPHVRKGDARSALLPGIEPAGPGKEGEGDRRIQAYCFRMCMTDHPDNRIPFHKPAGYEEADYELLFRNFEAGANEVPGDSVRMPNRKTDTNNHGGFSTDFIGGNYEYPEAGYAARAKIIARHLRYQQGLMWTLANSTRVPRHIRDQVTQWGMARDEFVDSGGWPRQLYIREARRMVGTYVMTQHNCESRRIAQDSVGMGAYPMDSHHVRRYVGAGGFVRNEGDVQVGGFAPYPIAYSALTPRQEQAQNLLVPVCLSATHIAFGSIRMEPVFMILGQSAATAAAIAMDAGRPIQQVDYAELRTQLLADGQMLGLQPTADTQSPPPPSNDPGTSYAGRGHQ